MANTDAQLVESWINGNRNWVRSKLKRKAKKRSSLAYAKEVLNKEDYEDFLNNAVLG
jgi:hypothetical protein